MIQQFYTSLFSRFLKAAAAGKLIKESKQKDAKQKEKERRDSFKKKKDGEKEDNSLKGIDVRQLHEAYQTLMKKYCPDAKKKADESEESIPQDEPIGMVAF